MHSPVRALFHSALAALVVATGGSTHAALLIHYKFDETTGNVANDSATGNGTQNGTAGVTASQWTGGIIGGGVNFTPTGQADVDEAFVYNHGSSLVASTFSTGGWFQTTSSTTYSRSMIFLGTAGQLGQYHAMNMSDAELMQAISRNETPVSAASPTALNNGNWNHVMGVWSATNSRSLFVNGILVATNTTNVPAPGTARFAVGALMRGSNTDGFSGLVDDVGLWNNALTAVDVALIHGLGRYSGVDLGSSSIADVLSVFTNGSGSAVAGGDTWEYATGLGSNIIGTSGEANGRAFIVLDTNGNGVYSLVPEPGRSTLLLMAALAMVAGKRRR